MPSTPNSGYKPAPARLRPLPVRAAGPQYIVATQTTKPPNKRTSNGRVSPPRNFTSVWAVTFFLPPRRIRPAALLVPASQQPFDRPFAERHDAPAVPNPQSPR